MHSFYIICYTWPNQEVTTPQENEKILYKEKEKEYERIKEDPILSMILESQYDCRLRYIITLDNVIK